MKYLSGIIAFLILVSCKTNTNSMHSSERLKGATDSSISSKSNIMKEEVYKAIFNFNQIYRKINKDIYFSYRDVYKMYTTGVDDEAIIISDEDRLSSIEKGLKNKKFKGIFSNDFYISIISFKDGLTDPESLGYLLLKGDLGKELMQILSFRDQLNIYIPDIPEYDSSPDMSAFCYKEYHKNRIHLVDNNKAIYKTVYQELALSGREYLLYFIFIENKTNKGNKWLLNNIEICPNEKEEAFDLKFFGELKPFTYFEPYCAESDPDITMMPGS